MENPTPPLTILACPQPDPNPHLNEVQVHVYHMIGGFRLSAADYFHHLLFIPALGFPGVHLLLYCCTALLLYHSIPYYSMLYYSILYYSILYYPATLLIYYSTTLFLYSNAPPSSSRRLAKACNTRSATTAPTGNLRRARIKQLCGALTPRHTRTLDTHAKHGVSPERQKRHQSHCQPLTARLRLCGRV